MYITFFATDIAKSKHLLTSPLSLTSQSTSLSISHSNHLFISSLHFHYLPICLLPTIFCYSVSLQFYMFSFFFHSHTTLFYSFSSYPQTFFNDIFYSPIIVFISHYSHLFTNMNDFHQITNEYFVCFYSIHQVQFHDLDVAALPKIAEAAKIEQMTLPVSPLMKLKPHRWRLPAISDPRIQRKQMHRSSLSLENCKFS